MNHFEVLGVPRALELDPSALDRAYREQSLRHHPDRVAAGAPGAGASDARNRREAAERTAAINEAYRTLKDPIRRAFYVLALHGIDLTREDGGATREMPLEFLEEVMTLREALETARGAGKLGDVEKLAADVRRRQDEALARARTELAALESASGAGGTERGDSLARAAHALAQVRYFTRFLEEVEAMEEEALG